MIIEFSKTLIESGLKIPDGADRWEFCDSVVRGLVIQLNAKTKTEPRYLLRYKRQGKTAYEPLGSIRELTLTQARKLATQKKVEHAQEAKQVVSKPAKNEMTLDQFWTDYYLPHAKLNKRSWKRDEQIYRIWIQPKFGGCKLIDFSRGEFLQYQTELAGTKLSPASQDHVAKQARHLLAMACQFELLQRNVLKGIRLRNVDNQLHDVATDEQLNKLVEILKTDSNRPVCNIITMLLSTAARLGDRAIA